MVLSPNNVYVTPNSFDNGLGDNHWGDTDAPSIQRGVDAASSGDTVNVEAGTYNEDVNVDKSVTLLGAEAGIDARTRTPDNESIINSPDGETELEISASNVTVNGFTVQGNTNSNVFGAGVYIVSGTLGCDSS